MELDRLDSIGVMADLDLNGQLIARQRICAKSVMGWGVQLAKTSRPMAILFDQGLENFTKSIQYAIWSDP